MRRLSDALKAHLDGQATTLCRCWRLTRRDGIVLGFTDHDEAIGFEGTVFEARTGLGASESEAEAGLSAGSQEIAGALSSLSIEEKDIAAGRYDGASVETILVNWSALDERIVLDVSELGEVKRNGASFTAELRGIEARLDRQRGRLYRRHCDAAFSDRRCGVDAGQSRFRTEGAIEAVGDDGSVVLVVSPPLNIGLFEPGRLVWTNGEALGLSADIASLQDLGEGRLRAVLLGGAVAGVMAGDGARLQAGCDKSFESCRARFANELNFRGFPHLPGNDAALAFARKDGRHDGSPVVP